MTGQHAAFKRGQEHTRTKGEPGCPTPWKWAYETRAAAKRTLRLMARFRDTRRPGGILSVYRCQCGWFHLGNRPAEKSREQVARRAA